MVLDAEVGLADRFDAGAGLVVEVHMAHANTLGQGLGIDGETVIVAGDFDHAVVRALDRVVGTAMAELQLVGFRTVGETQEPKSGQPWRWGRGPP